MDARLNLEMLLMQPLVPSEPICHCYEEPEIDCPDHGSMEFMVQQHLRTLTENFLLADTIRGIKYLADDLAKEGQREASLRILERLSEHIDLTPLPQWSFNPNPEAPF